MNEKIKKLIDKLNSASYAYYNSDSPIMSDEEYDLTLKELKKLEEETKIVLSTSPTQAVGAPILSELKKVLITPKPMLSLDKCHSDEEVAAFAGKHKMIAMVKLDGLSVRVKYSNGKLMSANTRGNGVEGTDITEHIKQFQNVPLEIPYQNEFIIDGEAIIKIADFEEINKNNEFKNPRNAASGALNVLDTKLVKERKLSFLAWDVVAGSSFKFLDQKLAEAVDYGFEITPFIINYSSIGESNKILMGFKNTYPCDGVVWKFNDVEYGNSLGQTSHHFKNGIAWKPEVEVVESVLKGIDWTMGRTGVLTPVAVFEQVDLDGSIVERASLHNLSVMKSTLGVLETGLKVKVYKANMIIPQILSAEPAAVAEPIEIPATCPICGGPTAITISNDGVENLICSNPNCSGKLINKLDHFCGKKGLDIKGLSKATLEKLIDWGWVNNFIDLYNLKEHKVDWALKNGFGVKSVENILAAINEARNVDLEKFISAIGIPLIGENVSKEICKHVDTYSEFRELVKSNFDFSQWEGFGPEKTAELLKYDYEIADNLAEMVNFNKKEKVENSNSLNDLTICITGSLNHYKNRNELKTEIENRGGHVTGSVSGKTSILINNDATSGSSKNVAAKKLGIPILTEEDFILKYLR